MEVLLAIKKKEMHIRGEKDTKNVMQIDEIITILSNFKKNSKTLAGHFGFFVAVQ